MRVGFNISPQIVRCRRMILIPHFQGIKVRGPAHGGRASLPEAPCLAFQGGHNEKRAPANDTDSPRHAPWAGQGPSFSIFMGLGPLKEYAMKSKPNEINLY